MRPSLSCATALRAARRLSTGSPKDSLARKTGLPLATSNGPPPIAPDMPFQLGVSVGRSSIVVPAGASVVRCGCLVPARDEHGAARRDRYRPTGRDLRDDACGNVIGHERGIAGSTSTATPLSAGVSGPQDEV